LRSGNGDGHVDKVNVCRVQLVQGLVTTFGGSYHASIYQGPSSPLSTSH